MKTIFYLIFVLIWIGLTGLQLKFPLILFTFLVPFIVIGFAGKMNLLPKQNDFNLRTFSYIAWLIKEIIISAIAISKVAWKKNIILIPGLEPIKTVQKKDSGITIYANSITLTPGTVVLSTEKNHLLVHAFDLESIDSLKEGKMDNKVLEIIK
jgi:multicomponent Na+:H+ antiporter subunit E